MAACSAAAAAYLLILCLQLSCALLRQQNLMWLLDVAADQKDHQPVTNTCKPLASLHHLYVIGFAYDRMQFACWAIRSSCMPPLVCCSLLLLS